jgi:hypothetical protein
MVVIQSKINRNIATNAILGFIPDVLIAWVATLVTDNGWVGFFVVLLGLQCVYLFVWLKTFIWSWLIFWVLGRRKMSAHMENFLLQSRFPRPPEYVGGITDYLAKVANDRKADAKVRIAAATEVGTLNGVKLAGKHSLGAQLHFAFEDALEKYAKRFPPRDEQEEDTP